MVKVIYIGHMDVCNIAIKGIRYDRWGQGETKNLPKELADILLLNVDFKLASGEKSPKKEEKKEVKFDLDGDGDVDGDDFSIAAKTLQHARKTNKEN